MLRFKDYCTLLENSEASQEGAKLKHLDHPEDSPLLYGHAGVQKAIGSMRSVAEGKSPVTMKWDGSPSIVIGHAIDPRDGKHKPFVATKSAFNKNPKINFSHEDIDSNHGHAPGLVKKLKAALDHLPKVLPKKGVYQGDMMYDHEDLDKKPGSTSFTPNTITYTVKGHEADRVNRSKVGAVFHTKYEGHDLASASAEPLTHEDYEKFGQHPDVWHRSAHMENPPLSAEDKKTFDKHISEAEKVAKKGGKEMFNATSIHQGEGNHLVGYMNHTVRTGEAPSVDGFKGFVKNKMQKEVDKLKSDAGKTKKSAEMQAHLDHIDKNAEHYDNLLQLHKHLSNAKRVLVNHFNNTSSDVDQHINGEKTHPEGYVSNTSHGSIKFVDRGGFSAANFARTRQ